MFDGSNWVCTSSVNGKWSDGATSGDIVYTGGKVGIGTDEPGAKLQVFRDNTIGADVNNLGRATILAENAQELALGIDSNEIMQKGDHLYIGASDMGSADGAGNIYFLTDSDSDGDMDTYPLTLRKDGFVGIGTESPRYLLDLSHTEPYISFTDTNDFADRDDRFFIRAAGDGSGEGRMHFGHYDHSEASEKYLISMDESGNLGIGTSSPAANLEISSGNSGDAILRIEADQDNNDEGDNPRIEFIQDGGLTGMQVGFDQYNDFALNPIISGSLQSTPLLHIELNGNTGIGTLSPDAKLDVEGSLQADTFTGEASIYTHKQDITTSGAVDVEYFTLPSTRTGETLDDAIAMVNETDGTVAIHRFNYSDAGLTYGEFEKAADPLTGFTSPNDAESFEYNDTTYLVVGDDSTEVKTYAWDATNQVFTLLSGDEIGVTGHIDTEVFSQDSRQIIALAQSSGIKLYEWDGSNFNNIQTISLADARHLYFFEADLNADDATEAYLAAAAGDNLFIYQWQNGQNFDPLTLAYTLEAPSAQNAHFFEVGDRQFLIVPSDGSDIDSPLYQWNGADFEIAQYINHYSGSVAAKNFELNGTQYLVITARGSGANNDYLLFYWHEDDAFHHRQSIVYKNTSGDLTDIEYAELDSNQRLIMAEGTTSRVLRLDQYNNTQVEDNLFVGGQDIIMSIESTQINTDGISYDDNAVLGGWGVFSFHADQEHRPGWDSPMASISARGGYFAGNVGIGTTEPGAKLQVFRDNTIGGDVNNLGRATILAENAQEFALGIDANEIMQKGNDLHIGASDFGSDDSAGNIYLRTDPESDGSLSEFALTVHKSGKVGIGTTSPAANLEISSGNDGDAVLRIEANEDNNSQREDHNPSIQFFQDGASSGMRMGLTEKAGDSYNSFAFFHTAGGTELETPALVIEQDNTIQMQGDVGIGTTSPSTKLHISSAEDYPLTIDSGTVNHGTTGIQFSSQDLKEQWGYLSFSHLDTESSGGDASFHTSSNQSVTNFIHHGGDFYVPDGDVYARGNQLTSDSRYKKDIQTLPSALKNILSLRGVSYYWKDRSDNTEQIGVIAQEVEKIYPQLVHTNEDGYKSVAYANLVSPLIEAVKQLHALYQGHADRLVALEAQNAEQDNHIAHQDERIAHQDELIVQLEVRLAALEAAQ